MSRFIHSHTIHIQEKVEVLCSSNYVLQSPTLNSFSADTYGITALAPNHPEMTENRKMRVVSVKGDTLVTRLRRPLLPFEWTECQLQSPSVVTLNKNINSHSLHIKCTKSI